MRRVKNNGKVPQEDPKNSCPVSTATEGVEAVSSGRPESNIPRYPWADLKPKRWPCTFMRRVRKRKLQQENNYIPVLVKYFASKHERYLLWELKGEPGIPRLLGITDSFPYALIMERYPCSTLQRQRHFLNHWTCLLVLKRVCEIVAGLHARGITHGDLRAANINFVAKKEVLDVTIVNFDYAVRLWGRADRKKYVYLRRDLRQIYKLLTLLTGLSAVKEYVAFVHEVKTRLEDERPLPAVQIGAKIATLLRAYSHRPTSVWLWFVKGTKKVSLSQGSEEASSPSEFPGMVTPSGSIPAFQTSRGWPPRDAAIARFPWSDVTPQPWPLKCKFPAREGTLRVGDVTRPVIVKLMTPTSERYVLHDLQGVPNIPVLIGTTSHRPHALILETYRGSTFRWLRCIGDTRACLSGLAEICVTLAALHARGVVHGDVSERNIIIHRRRENVTVTLINFERSCHFMSMEEPLSGTVLREELKMIEYLVLLLRGLRVLPEYKRLLASLKSGQEGGGPMPAELVAKELELLKESYNSRRGFFQRCWL